jgi:hypothetical protein
MRVLLIVRLLKVSFLNKIISNFTCCGEELMMPPEDDLLLRYLMALFQMILCRDKFMERYYDLVVRLYNGNVETFATNRKVAGSVPNGVIGIFH